MQAERSGDKYRNFIFDFDGTLADTLPVLVRSINQFSRKYRYRTIDPEELPRLRLLSARELIKDLRMSRLVVPLVVREGIKLLNKEIGSVPLVVAALKQTLHRLKSEYDAYLGIVTSNSKSNVRAFLKSHNLFLFDFIESSVSLFGKHLVLRKVMQRKGLSCGDTIYIGDEIRDIDAARDARLKVGAVAWGYNTVDALKAKRPDYLFYQPDDLLSVAAVK